MGEATGNIGINTEKKSIKNHKKPYNVYIKPPILKFIIKIHYRTIFNIKLTHKLYITTNKHRNVYPICNIVQGIHMIDQNTKQNTHYTYRLNIKQNKKTRVLDLIKILMGFDRIAYLVA